ncbi:putative FBD-associated F-box protein At5g56690 isoform X2 [Phragmites australis]|nr:putative FBD-associated F-box protein At5g56690 isoform X2 [Phragmites australis]XP_062205861.1 putative FBD-associated F-box protein At5g56690 isoform X2 [Phragmites australis]
MGNVLNLIGGRTASQQCHPEHKYQGRIQHYQFELWSILICRAISEYICRKLIYEKGTVNDQFRKWNILFCRTVSEYISNKLFYVKTIADAQFLQRSIQMFKAVSHDIHKLIYGKGTANDQFQLWTVLLWGAISRYIYRKPIYKKGISIDQFVNLPEDVQCIILSKLPLKEVVRTSVLSSKWRCLWTVCPKLSFDGTIMFGKGMNGKQREHYTLQFINTVNEVLQQCHGRVVEELVIKFGFDNLLVDHLNTWVRFAASSHTKFLAFDLTPRGLKAFDDPQYIFPFQLFNSRSISHLQYVQLRFVSVKLPTQFIGFPKLRKLDLHKVKVTAKDLQDMLSNCCALEWLSIVHCNMDGELKVLCPLPCLLYLNVAYCGLTKMEFHAVKLRTFVYKGSAVPINFSVVSELKNANIVFAGVTIGDAIAALANVLTNVQNLSFDIYVNPPEVPCLMENPCKFSHLKCLQLLLSYDMDVDNPSLVPFLAAAPFIEKLEVHFSSLFGFYYMKGASIRRFRHTYNHLKDVCITGFKASSGQIEFLVHIVENTPALEVLTIDPLDRQTGGDPLIVIEREAGFMDAAYRIVREYIEGNVSPKCSLRLLF